MGHILIERIRSWRRSHRLLVLLAVLSVTGGFGFWIAHHHFSTIDHREQARQAIERYDFDAAKEHLNASLAARSEDGEAHFLLARVYRRGRIEDFAQAHHHLDDARRLGWSQLETALEGLMLAFQEQGTSKETEKTLTGYTVAGESSAPLVFEALARGCIRADRMDNANTWLNAWVERYPDDWYARLWRGAFFEYTAKANLAVPDFQSILEKWPDDEEIRLHLGLMLVQSGYNYGEALSHLESYRQRHPDSPDALVGIAGCQRALRQAKSARSLLEQVIAAHPDHVDALRILASLALDEGNDDEALKWLRRLEPLAHRSHYFERLDRLSRLEPVPNNIDVPNQLREVFHLLAGVLHRKGRHEEAESYERQAYQLVADRDAVKQALAELEGKPHDADLMYRIATLFFRLEMKEHGVTWLRHVLEERPGDPRASEMLAKYSASRKD
ncbi:MAG TPA: tetratricopeptide repeat protein [Gemmataceae bacterium]|jgi:tetratricopeptide (TPR) repeat protein